MCLSANCRHTFPNPDIFFNGLQLCNHLELRVFPPFCHIFLDTPSSPPWCHTFVSLRKGESLSERRINMSLWSVAYLRFRGCQCAHNGEGGGGPETCQVSTLCVLRPKSTLSRLKKFNKSEHFTISIFIKHVRGWDHKAFQGLTSSRRWTVLLRWRKPSSQHPMICSNNHES